MCLSCFFVCLFCFFVCVCFCFCVRLFVFVCVFFGWVRIWGVGCIFLDFFVSFWGIGLCVILGMSFRECLFGSFVCLLGVVFLWFFVWLLGWCLSGGCLFGGFVCLLGGVVLFVCLYEPACWFLNVNKCVRHVLKLSRIVANLGWVVSSCSHSKCFRNNG